MIKSLAKNILSPFRNLAASARELGRRGKTELQHLGSWLLKLAAWAAYPLLTAGIITTSVVIPALWFGASEQAVRWAGVILQLGGLVTVVCGIDRTRRFFRLPGLRSVPGEWWKRRPSYRRATTIHARMDEALESTDNQDAYSTASLPTQTLEDRIKALESNQEHVHKRLDEVNEKVDRSTRTQTQALTQERSERTAEDTKIRERLALSHTGGLHISLMGAVWLFFGLVLSGIAWDIACWLTGYKSC